MYSQTIALNKAYERFVPTEFLNFLGKESILDVELGNQVQNEMTVLFSDIRNFTSISELMSPQENFNFINDFLGKMEPIVCKHNGFIVKFIEDAIMALFPGNAYDTLQFAIEMQKQLKKLTFNNSLTISMGICINTGLLVEVEEWKEPLFQMMYI